MKNCQQKSPLFFAVLTLLMSSSDLQAQGEVEWAKTYGGLEKEGSRCVQQTSDEGYIFVGETASYGAGDRDIWLVKTDAVGETLWTKTYGGSFREGGFSVQQTSEGGYIIIGFTESFGLGDSDIWLLKTDSDGDTMWTKTYGGSAGEDSRSVQQTSDGGYIIAGDTESYGAGDGDVWLIKTDEVGDTLWTKTIGGILNDGSWCVQQTTDGGYIIAGFTESFGSGKIEKMDVWLIKTDAFGDTLWTKTYGDSLDNKARYVQQTSDSGYILSCVTELQDFANRDCWLIKTDAMGDTVWTKTYGGPGEDDGRCVQETLDGGYIITGIFSTQVAIEDDIWYKGYIVVGRIRSPADGNLDVWLIKIYPDAAIGDISDKLTNYPADYILHQNYPNPFNPSTTIEFTLSHPEYTTLKVYNILGKEVATLVSNKLNQGNHTYQFVGKNLASGIYYYQLVAGDYREVKKMILLR
jgi:hypothetical protein